MLHIRAKNETAIKSGHVFFSLLFCREKAQKGRRVYFPDYYYYTACIIGAVLLQHEIAILLQL